MPVHTVLDLACGTGTHDMAAGRRGYEMIGVDGSEEMLAQAADKAAGTEGSRRCFLHQSMPQLRPVRHGGRRDLLPGQPELSDTPADLQRTFGGCTCSSSPAGCFCLT